MSKKQYKVVYSEAIDDKTSKNYRSIIFKTKYFANMNDAVRFSRGLSNTNPRLFGRPTVDVTQMNGK